MQRVRVTDAGLQANFGADILTIERDVTSVMGDSFGFSYKGSVVGAKDFMHGPDFNTSGDFTFAGRDPIDLFIDGTDKLLAKEREAKPEADGKEAVEDFPEADQHFYEYTLDRYTRVAAIGVSSTVMRERRRDRDPTVEDTYKLSFLTGQLVEKLAVLLEPLGESSEPMEPVDRPDVASFGYPLGIEEDDTVVLFAQQSQDNLRLVLNNALRERIRVPAFSMQRLATWMRTNYNDPDLKKKSIWG